MITNIYSKRILPLLALAVVVVTASSCVSKFEYYNTNPDEATDDMMDTDGLRVGARLRQMMRNVVIFADGDHNDSDYQIAQNLSHDIYSGFLGATIETDNGNHNGAYNFVENWHQLMFNNGFVNIMQPWSKIFEEHEKNDLPNELAVATIVKVMGMHRVADTYGPIPYSSFVAGSTNNDYESLEDVYKAFFAELDESISTLTALQNANPEDKLMERFDMIYGGDVDKWIKLANTLRLRLAMRISNVNPTLAQQQVTAVMNNPHGVISDPSQRAALQHSAINYIHPLYEIAYNFNDTRAGASLVTYMNAFDDPRLPVYFTQATQAAGSNPVPGYYGVLLGVQSANWDNYRGARISNLNVNSGTEIVWITAAESYFLLAEAAYKGWVGGSAQDYYENGIRASFSENGASNVDTYLAVTATASGFVDNSGEGTTVSIGSSGIPTAVDFSTVGVAWANDGKQLARIALQKWIALYPDGPEGWAEYRRTGMPYLFPTQTNNSNGTVNTTLQVRRLPYPQSEYDTNMENVTAAVNSLLGGPDTGGTPLWWDTRN